MKSTKESPLVVEKKTASGVKRVSVTKGIWRKSFVLAIEGGLAFWLANFAISRTPIAAEYRADLSISYFPMLLEALIGGLIIGLLVSFLLLRFFDRIPAKDPVLKSVILSVMVLLIITISIGNPSTFNGTNDVLRCFVLSFTFNLFRIAALGTTIGYSCKRQHIGMSQEVCK